MTCPQESEVHAYHDDELPPARRLAVESHLAGCDACAALRADLRDVSRRVATAPLPEVSAVPFDRYYDVWDRNRDRGVLRISGWLTAAAAAVLVGSLVLLPADHTPVETATAAKGSWEPVALMAPVLETPDQDEQLVEVAQWMANDLAGN